MLALRGYRRFWLASIASNAGTWLHVVAAGWLIFQETGSPAAVGALALATRGPSILLAPLAGSIADRFDRRWVGISANGLQALAAGGLAALAVLGLAGAEAIIGLTLVLGIGFAMGLPAQLALVPALAPPERLSQAVALNSAGINVARLVGPALGGVVLATAGAATSFALNAVSFAAVVVALATVSPRPTPRGHQAGVREGIRFARVDPTMRRLLVGMAIFTGLASSVQELAPVIAERLGAGPVGLGLLLGAMGAGALVGVVALEATVGRTISRSLALPAATTTFGALMVLLAFAPNLTVGLLVIAGCGACWICMFAGTNTGVQLRAPRHLLGRMLGLYQLAVIGPIAIGPILIGAIAQPVGIGPALLVAATGLGAWGLWALRHPPRGRGIAGEAVRPSRAPA